MTAQLPAGYRIREDLPPGYVEGPDGNLRDLRDFTVSPEAVKAGNPNGHLRTMAELLANPPVVTPRLLEPSWIVQLGLDVLAAPTKTMKTNLQLHKAWALTSGTPLFGRFAAPRPVAVLMLQLELSEATMYERLQVLREQLGWSEEAQRRFFLRCERALLLDRRGGADHSIKLIEECPERPEVVILDSFNAAVAGDPDKSGEARKALHALREVQERTGVAWSITSEIRKAPASGRLRYHIDDLKGSNELAYDSDAVLVLRPLDESRRRLAMHFLAMRHATEEPPEGIVLVRRGLSFELTEGPGDELEDSVLKVLRERYKQNGELTWRCSRDAVREAGLKVSNDTITYLRKRLLAGEGQ